MTRGPAPATQSMPAASAAQTLPKTDDDAFRAQGVICMMASALLSLVAGLVIRRREREEDV